MKKHENDKRLKYTMGGKSRSRSTLGIKVKVVILYILFHIDSIDKATSKMILNSPHVQLIRHQLFENRLKIYGKSMENLMKIY